MSEVYVRKSIGEHDGSGPQVVDEQLRRRADAIAAFMGGDYNMTVGVGPPGSGWHWDFGKNHVNMDAKDLYGNSPDVAKGAAAHEGNHRYFSRPDYVQDLWQEPGFAFGYNALEDPRVNQGGMKFRPGSRDWIKAYIEEDLSPGGGLDYQSLEKDAQRSLGYVPKHMKWGSEMIRYWHAKELGDGIKTDEDRQRFLAQIPDDDVRETVQQSIPAFEEFYATLPDTKDEMEVRRKAKESADKFRERVWPQYQQLVEKSYDDHSLVKMLEDMLSQDADQSGDQSSDGQGQGKPQIMVVPFSSLPKDIQDEIKQKMQDTKSKDKPQPARDSSQAEGGEQPSGQKEGQGSEDDESQQGNGKQQLGSGSGQEDGPERENGQQAGSSSDQEGDKGGQQDLSGMQDMQPGLQPGNNQDQSGETDQAENEEGNEDQNEGEDGAKVPWDQLSQKAKQAVKDTFDSLPEEQQEDYKDRAKQELEDTEDEANKKLRGKMIDPREAETHKERREREQREQERESQQAIVQQAIEDMERRREKALSNIQQNPYQEVLVMPEVAGIIRDLDRDYKRIFAPDEDPSVRYSSTGLRPSMAKAMQRDADPRRSNVFEIKGRPQEKDYRFLSLIDLSPSMQDKIREVFKTVVIGAELDNRHGLENAIVGLTDTFRGNIRVYKDFDVKKLDKAARDKIGGMLADCYRGSGTPLLDATRKSYRLLKKRMSRSPSSKHNYFITITDGQSTDSSVEDLREEIRSLRKDKSIIVCGYGIGPGTDYVNVAYPMLPEMVRREIARVLGKTPDQITNSFANAVEFAKASVIIKRYMVEQPELFM